MRASARCPQLFLSIVIAFSHLCFCKTPTKQTHFNFVAHEISFVLNLTWIEAITASEKSSMFALCVSAPSIIRHNRRFHRTFIVQPILHKTFKWLTVQPLEDMCVQSIYQARKSVDCQYSVGASASPSDQKTSGLYVFISSFISGIT